MKLNKLLYFILISILVISCSGGGGGGGGGTSVTISSIAVTPANPSIAKSVMQQFIATGTYSNKSTKDITSSVTWSSSNTDVATIGSSSGLATAIDVGTTTIQATSESISGSTTLTVTPPVLASIQLTPASPSISRGGTQQFTATGTYSDSSTKDITTSVTWSSSSPCVATISNTAGSNGLATSLTAAATTITASSGSISRSTILTVQALSNDNVLAVTVNGSLCSNSYPNKPCVSVTVCSPGTSNCKTITDILLDTGASGLRIFKSLLTDIPLTQVTSGTGSLADCIQYADGSAEWGPVQRADIILGNESAVNVPIQVIDSTFSNAPSSCGTPDTTPAATGFNGVLGAGLFKQDCGSLCANSLNNMYYSCSSSRCTATKVPLSSQVQNPVSQLLVDNNGVILQLPSVSPGGAVSVDGVLILGIDTRSNNSSSGVTMYPADPNLGEFITIFNGTPYSNSFIDSGSNGLFFNASSVSTLIQCSSPYDAWYCPSSTLSLSANTEGYEGSPNIYIPFQIGNAVTLFSSSNNVFIELGGPESIYFDWGLPFFFGRNVYVGIEGTTSSLGTGPYWAY
jgi:hypothetical protein